MIILGLVLLVVGIFTGISILTTIGVILMVVGAILWILGASGRAVRRTPALLVTEIPPGSHHPRRSQSLGVKVTPSFHRVRELGGRIHERSTRFVIATRRLRSDEGTGAVFRPVERQGFAHRQRRVLRGRRPFW